MNRCVNQCTYAGARLITTAFMVVNIACAPALTFAAAGAGHEAAWVKKRTSDRSVALDVKTMKAAKISMLAMDQAAHSSRRQEFDALDKRNRNWFDFR